MIARGLRRGRREGLRLVAEGRRCATRSRPSCRRSASASASRPTSRPRPSADALAEEIGAREDRAAHPGEQRGRDVGRAARRVSRRRAWDKVLNLNVKAPFHLTRCLRPAARGGRDRRRPGRGSSTSGRSTASRCRSWRRTRTRRARPAVHQLTRHLARQLGPRKITVNAVAPGPFESKMMAATLRNFGDSIAAASPLKRIGRPDDMAGVAIYLASRGRRLRHRRRHPGRRRHRHHQVAPRSCRHYARRMADDLARVDALIDDLLADARSRRRTETDRVPRRAVRPRPRVGALPRRLRRARTSRRSCNATSTAGCATPARPRRTARLFFGLSLAGPTVATHGSDELRRRALRPMFTGEEIWCQLFSEPGAGSDLAGLATRAVRDGDEWVVNGQKVWNTLAHLADRGMLVARTDPELPEAQGPHVLHGRHARARRRGAAAAPDHRRGRVQRGVPHRRAHRRRRSHRRHRRRLARVDDHAR